MTTLTSYAECIFKPFLEDRFWTHRFLEGHVFWRYRLWGAPFSGSSTEKVRMCCQEVPRIAQVILDIMTGPHYFCLVVLEMIRKGNGVRREAPQIYSEWCLSPHFPRALSLNSILIS